MRIYPLLLLLGFSLASNNLYAQKGYSFTIGAGASYYYGDISSGLSNLTLRPTIQLSTGYYFTPSLSLRFGLAYTTLAAADSLSSDPLRRKRDLHFKSTVVEVSGILYYEFLPDKRFGYYYFNKPHFTPYIFAGVAIFGHNPKAYYNGEWVQLAALGTEGQHIKGGGYPEPYSLMQVAFPFGGGLNFRFSSNVAISFDLGYRKVFTDYLDDVSTNYPDFSALEETGGVIAVDLSDPSGKAITGQQRGNTGSKDSYLFGILSITFYLDKDGKL